MRTKVLNALQELSPSIDWERKFEGVVVAGGFVRDTIGDYPRLGDIDFFIPTDRANSLRSGLNWVKDVDHPKCFTTTIKGTTLQLIPVARDPLEFIQERFDLICCCGAVELGTNREWFHPDFEADVKSRVLRINSLTAIGHKTLIRVLRFRGLGWTIDNDTLSAIIGSVVMNTPTAARALINEDQLVGELRVLFKGSATVQPTIQPVQRYTNNTTVATEPPTTVDPEDYRAYLDPTYANMVNQAPDPEPEVEVAPIEEYILPTRTATQARMQDAIEGAYNQIRQEHMYRGLRNTVVGRGNEVPRYTNIPVDRPVAATIGGPLNWDGTPMANPLREEGRRTITTPPQPFVVHEVVYNEHEETLYRNPTY